MSADVAAKAVALHGPGNAAQMPPVGLKHDHRPTPLRQQVGGGAGTQFRNAGLPGVFRWAAMPCVIAVSAGVFIPFDQASTKR